MIPPRGTKDFDTAAIAKAVADEISGVHLLPIPPPSGPPTVNWVWIRNVVGVAVATIGIMYGVTRSYFVTRAEYTERVEREVIDREALRQALNRLDRTLTEHTTVLREEAAAIQDLRIGLAVVQAGKK